MMLKWLPISADLEMALILFGLGILFYLKRVLREEESHKLQVFSMIPRI